MVPVPSSQATSDLPEIVEALAVRLRDALVGLERFLQHEPRSRLAGVLRKKADAEAYRTRTLAEAERDRVRFAADAEAYRTRALSEAQAEAIRARADSLREGNQELIAANRLIEVLPSLVEAAARGLKGSNLTVLNGTQGVNEVVAGLVGQGLAILDTLKQSTAVPRHAAPVPVSGTASVNVSSADWK